MKLALTSSSWINAWSLRQACLALGVDLRVPAKDRLLPLPVLPEDATAEWLFFTEESSLRRALEHAARGDVPAGASFLPSQFPTALLDDKWAFAEFLAQDPAGPQCPRQWPLADAGDATFPLLLKCRHSWVGARKLPRGWVCEDANALSCRRNALAAQGLDEAWFFLQAWLTGPSTRVLSVGGFFDAQRPTRNLALVTDRVADYGQGPSSSAALVTVEGDLAQHLIAAAARILTRLAYCGPYELEFLVTEGRSHVLELNPRFWMQHGLYGASGNGLVKRYLGQDNAADHALPSPTRLLWVDGIWLLRRLARADPRLLRLWSTWVWKRGYRAVICPPPGAAIGAALWRAATRLAGPFR